MKLWGPGVECCGLNIKYLPQAHVLKSSSLDFCTILEGSGNFRRWGLAGGSRLQGVFLGLNLS
jgi:hypothetical protein